MTGYIFSIDPGDVQTAIVVLDVATYKPVVFVKSDNYKIYDFIFKNANKYSISVAAIEMVASYGMAVGRSVFETCVWIGRYTEYLRTMGIKVNYIYRKDVKLNICGQTRAKDSNIRMALIDRFAKFDFKTGKGVKMKPDWFYGFKADVWQAYAVGVTWLDKNKSM